MLKIIKISVLLTAFSGALSSSIVLAQTVPDAGSLMREIEKEKELPEPKKPEPSVSPAPAPIAKQAATASVTVNAFLFTGNTLIETEVLEKAMVGFLKRPLTFAELEAAAARVAEVYRQAGWVARPTLPPQDITGGEVKIAIVEATFGVTRINDEENLKRISAERLIAIIKSQQPKGQFINANALDNALRRINELPGISVNGVLKAGERAGETDLVLNVDQSKVISANASLDNYGSKFTGEERLIATGILNSPLGYGERFSATVLYSEGTTFGQLGASMPVGVGGWQIGTHASALNYSLGDVDVEGSSSEIGLDANYPLLRSKDKSLSFALAYDNTSFKNTDQFGDSEYAIGGLDATLTGQYFDKIGGVNQATLIFASGTVDDKTGNLSEALGERYNKVRYGLNRQQRLTDRFSLYGSFNGQAADCNLTSSEKFTLGGTSGVRAYRSSEGSGDEGQLLTAELRARLPYNFSVAAFYDVGTVTVEKNPSSNLTTTNSYTLSGAGLSARWQSKLGMGLKATWAKPIGDNKGASSSIGEGYKQDKDLIWLQATMSY